MVPFFLVGIHFLYTPKSIGLRPFLDLFGAVRINISTFSVRLKTCCSWEKIDVSFSVHF